MIRRIVKTIEQMTGVMIVPEWRAIRVDQEQHLSRLFRCLDVDCVFDVGANVGQYARMLRDYVGYHGRIVSFEPNPAALGQLEAAASRDALWHVERIALGSTSGMAQFHAYDQSEFGSFRNFSKSLSAPKFMASETISVAIRTLEPYLAEAKTRWNFKRPFLKLDTQGFDLEVAKGAGQALSEFVGLQSEIAFQTIYEGAPDFISALHFYQSFGFVVSRLVPIPELNLDFPKLLEMDLIMVRADLTK